MLNSPVDRKQYYQTHIIATVQFKDEGFRVLDGKPGKEALKIAMKYTPQCYVRDYLTGHDVLLTLERGKWLRKQR